MEAALVVALSVPQDEEKNHSVFFEGMLFVS